MKYISTVILQQQQPTSGPSPPKTREKEGWKTQHKREMDGNTSAVDRPGGNSRS